MKQDNYANSSAARLPELLEAAQQAFAAGQLATAAGRYREILRHYPDHSFSLHALGIIQQQLGETDEALRLLQQAVTLQPDYREARFNLATLLIRQNTPASIAAAIDQLQTVLELQPDIAGAYTNLGHAYELQQNTAAALNCFRRAWELDPNQPLIQYNYGCTLHKNGQKDEAIAHLQKALQLNPRYLEAFCNLGMIAQENGDLDSAIDYFRRALQVEPGYTPALVNLGNCYKERADYPAAIACYQQVLAGQPDHAGSCYNLGNAYREAGQFADAETWYRKTLALMPDMVSAYTNLGFTLLEQSRPAEAVSVYNQALALSQDPDIYGNRSQALLMTGDLETGFAEYRWRTQTPKHRPLFDWCAVKPRWTGDYFSGKRLLVHDEQGFGDSLQFVRYLPQVKSRGGTVILSAKKELLSLYQHLSGADYVIEHAADPIESLRFDLAVPLLNLPHIFGTTLATIPAATPYLQADPALIAAWRQRLPVTGQPRVGLVWSGNPANIQGRKRTCGLAALEPLLSVTGLSFFSLQKGDAGQEVQEYPFAENIIDLTPDISSFADTAALMVNLDLILSIDTSVIHLAGALGCPVWTLLPFGQEWRWLLKREDSPWYPSMRLFRQPQPGDWAAVVKAVTRELTLWRDHRNPVTSGRST